MCIFFLSDRDFHYASGIDDGGEGMRRTREFFIQSVNRVKKINAYNDGYLDIYLIYDVSYSHRHLKLHSNYLVFNSVHFSFKHHAHLSLAHTIVDLFAFYFR